MLNLPCRSDHGGKASAESQPVVGGSQWCRHVLSHHSPCDTVDDCTCHHPDLSAAFEHELQDLYANMLASSG